MPSNSGATSGPAAAACARRTPGTTAATMAGIALRRVHAMIAMLWSSALGGVALTQGMSFFNHSLKETAMSKLLWPVILGAFVSAHLPALAQQQPAAAAAAKPAASAAAATKPAASAAAAAKPASAAASAAAKPEAKKEAAKMDDKKKKDKKGGC